MRKAVRIACTSLHIFSMSKCPLFTLGVVRPSSGDVMPTSNADEIKMLHASYVATSDFKRVHWTRTIGRGKQPT